MEKILDWDRDKEEIIKLIYISDKTADKEELLKTAVWTISAC